MTCFRRRTMDCKDQTNTREHPACLWVQVKVKKEEIDNRVYYFLPLPAGREMREVRTPPTPYPYTLYPRVVG
jgi:hypothetical protein